MGLRQGRAGWHQMRSSRSPACRSGHPLWTRNRAFQHSLVCGAPVWLTPHSSSRCARCIGLQLCTVAAWAWGWETDGAPRGSWDGKEPSKEDYEAINCRSCYWFRIGGVASPGTNLCPWERELRRETRPLVCDTRESLGLLASLLLNKE